MTERSERKDETVTRDSKGLRFRAGLLGLVLVGTVLAVPGALAEPTQSQQTSCVVGVNVKGVACGTVFMDASDPDCGRVDGVYQCTFETFLTVRSRAPNTCTWATSDGVNGRSIETCSGLTTSEAVMDPPEPMGPYTDIPSEGTNITFPGEVCTWVDGHEDPTRTCVPWNHTVPLPGESDAMGGVGELLDVLTGRVNYAQQLVKDIQAPGVAVK